MKRTIRERALAFLLTLVLLFTLVPAAFAAEAGDGEETTPGEGETTPGILTSVAMNRQNLPLVMGESSTLTVTVDGISEDELEAHEINWTTRNNTPERVRVTPSADGLSATVTAVTTAETTVTDPVTVTVTINHNNVVLSAHCNVTVQSNIPLQLEIAGDDEVEVSGTLRLRAEITPAEREDEAGAVTWSSSDTSVATVDEETGAVTGVAPGEATITARSASGLTDTHSVKVRGILLPESITVRTNNNERVNLEAFGEAVELQVERNNVTWSSSPAGIVQVQSGYIYPLLQGTATITATVSANNRTYEAACDVTVERNTADVITAEASAASPLRFSQISSQIQRECRGVLGSSLSYISGLWVNTSQGTLYYRYQSEGDTGLGVGTGEYYYVSPGSSQRALSDLAFVPKSDFSGTAEITYTGYVNGTTFFQGTIQVDVEEAEDVAYSASEDKPLQFNASDFDLVCRNRTGRSLSYVRFDLPDEDDGTLYYRYISADNPGVRVDEDTQYRLGGSPNLGDVYFVPAEGTSGRVVIAYTGYNVNGDSFRGRLEIQVGKGSGDAGGGEVRYSISQGGRVTLDVDDFNDLSLDETGEDLDRVRFTLPASSRGTLYYNYTSGGSYDSRVTASRSYYADSFPYLDRVTFAANSSFTGTVEIDFTAWNIDNERFTGVLAIQVGNSSASRTISYTTSYNAPLTLDDQDFSDLYRSETDETLDYVQFELPSSAQGRLYYNYDDGEYDSAVSASRRYYRSQNPRLDRVTFVPTQGFSGSVSFSFTGRGSGGSSFSGTVSITVEEPPQATVIYYLADGGPVTFRAQDFRSACQARGMGELAYVRFTLPSSSYGRLYEGYASASQPGAAVSSVTNYYPGGTPSISQVAFVPKVGYQGTVTILYQGYDTQGTTYSGRVQIQVRPSTVSSYFSDLGSYSWAVPAVDFLYENGIVGGVGGGRYGPSLSVTRGDYVLMLCRAFDLPLGSGTPFWDVPEDRYYAQAVAGAQALGLVSGYADGGFHPNDPVSRQDAAVMLVRAMQADGWSFGAGQESLLLSFQDRGSIADYARSSMAILVEYGVLSGTTSTTLGPQQLVSRAEVAVMLANALTL